MSGFSGKNVLVVGLGASGMAAVRVLREEGARVKVTERRSEVPERDELERIGVDMFAGEHSASHLDGVDIVVASPGVFESAPVLAWARERDIPILSELELGARLCTIPFIAVTGTNGKTTTVEMIRSVMSAAGLDSVACGNIGHPFSLAAREHHDALAVEASSFQLRFDGSFHPKVSVLLNLAPDHLDWHGTFEGYGKAKSQIFALQRGEDTHVGNSDDPVSSRISASAPCSIRWFKLGEPGEGEVGFVNGDLVARVENETKLGHVAGDAGFQADAAAAAAACIAFGIAGPAVADGLANMEPLPHRGETVTVAAGVTFVNDSKATNPHAALAGLDGREDVVLIAGGLSKGVDLSPLASATSHLKGVVAIGEAAAEVVAVFESKVPVCKAGSMEEAVREAFEIAAGSGTVLLAPACASQDMFEDYRDRGERFAEAAQRLSEEVDDG